MKKTVYYYIIVMTVLCLATLGTVGLLTANSNTSTVTFGTSSDTIKFDADTFGVEIKNVIFSFLPSR